MNGKSKDGFSLVEIIISISIFLVIITASYLIYTQALRISKSKEEAPQLLNTSNALNLVVQDLREAIEICYPTISALSDKGSSALVFLDEKDNMIGYLSDQNSRRILRVIYGLDEAAEEYYIQSEKVVAEDIDSLNFSLDEDYLISITATRKGNPLLKTKTTSKVFDEFY